jgi:hypothetical protein
LKTAERDGPALFWICLDPEKKMLRLVSEQQQKLKKSGSQ